MSRLRAYEQKSGVIFNRAGDGVTKRDPIQEKQLNNKTLSSINHE